MKIEQSTVRLDSQNYFHQQDTAVTSSIVVSNAEAARIDLSDEANAFVAALKKGVEAPEETKTENRNAANRQTLESLLKRMRGDDAGKAGQIGGIDPGTKRPTDLKIEVLKKILEGLRHGRMSKLDIAEFEKADMKSFSESFTKSTFSVGIAGQAGTPTGTAIEVPGGMTTFTRISATHFAHSEEQATMFNGVGTVKTADGREIDFNITLGMTRSFAEEYTELSKSQWIACDPLVINTGSGSANISDQKFLFDLDSDGKEEEISYATGGSGFLALDKNGDGKINDGSELFGTKSGNGFADLAKYDDDGNGWIDENDEVFNRLKIWSINDDGTQELVAIGQKGVGAIFLGSTQTDFTLDNNSEGGTNGFIRSTGVFLKENGEAGTIQHVDLTL